jgi:hypothetical protein
MRKLCYGSFRQGMQRTVLAVCMVGFSSSLATAKEPLTPKEGPIDLLENGLKDFYTWSRETQYEDPLQVYSYADAVLRISGEAWGGLTTNDQYANYHMVFEFKWGERTWDPRKDRARDSGILVHCTGIDGSFYKTWMASVEAQIIEGGVGDILVLNSKAKDGTFLPVSLSAEVVKDRNGETIWKRGGELESFTSGRINWYGRDLKWKDELGFRGREDVESPHGEWTRYEIICDGGSITILVNGTVVNEAFHTKPSFGKILIQSEGAEIFIRRWKLWPVGEAPRASQE